MNCRREEVSQEVLALPTSPFGQANPSLTGLNENNVIFGDLSLIKSFESNPMQGFFIKLFHVLPADFQILPSSLRLVRPHSARGRFVAVSGASSSLSEL